MTGDKPDERLRTPMQWRRAAAGGFTTGKAWQALQPDSLTANVETQEHDPGSLLNWHRRLIHLRADNPALATGRLIELEATDDAVAAFVRRQGNRAVLVVSNLGTIPLRGVRISSRDSVIEPGRYALRPLLGGVNAAQLRVAEGGLIKDFVVLRTLGPLAAYVFELASRGRR
jgi:glycosidase